MSHPDPPTPEDLARQGQQHLDALRAAGVEWAPRSRKGRKAAPPEAAASAGGLFAGLPGEGPMAVPAVERTVEERTRELTVLRERVAGCTRCPALVSTRRKTVFGVGPLGAELCFIGEAPGQEEDIRGEPFVGPAGQLLDRIISACGLKRDEVYICNIIKCRPPANRAPAADEASNCREYLDQQLELVAPRCICCLGAVAAQNLLGTSQNIGKLRGRFLDHRGVPVMCTYHPSYLLRIPDEQKKNEAKRQVWEDMQKVLVRLGRPIPPAGGTRQG